LYRRWDALVPAIAVPVTLSALVMLAAPATREYVDSTLPLLLEGQSSSIQGHSIALPSVLDRFSVPEPISLGLELMVFGVICVLVWRRWRRDDLEPRRLVEIVSLVLVGAFLLSSFSFVHYGIFLLPLAISLADPASPHRTWLMVGALFVLATRQSWQLDLLPDDVNRVLAERFTFGLVLVLVAFAVALLGQPREAVARTPERRSVSSTVLEQSPESPEGATVRTVGPRSNPTG